MSLLRAVATGAHSAFCRRRTAIHASSLQITYDYVPWSCLCPGSLALLFFIFFSLFSQGMATQIPISSHRVSVSIRDSVLLQDQHARKKTLAIYPSEYVQLELKTIPADHKRCEFMHLTAQMDKCKQRKFVNITCINACETLCSPTL